MTTVFQPGDIVRRTGADFPPVRQGKEYTVARFQGTSLWLEGLSGAYSSVRFELAGKGALIPDTPPKQDATQVGGNHYTKMAIQPYEYAHKNKLGYLEANVVKYVSRHGAKNGKQDLLKAIHSLQVLIELQYPEV